MKEEFLHVIWKYQLFETSQLYTTHHQPTQILSTGTHNQLAGPDFLNAKVQIGDQLWIGNVEIHLKASDWYAHKHELDPNYGAVVLHVVWEEDAEVYGKDNKPIPTLELKGIVYQSALLAYDQLQQSHRNWIPCQKQISTLDTFYLKQWYERLYVERLEHKSIQIFELLHQTSHDWEAVLFQLLAKNFGLNINGGAFLNWSQSIPFSLIRRNQSDLLQLTALFFGQAGMLHDSIEEGYYQRLQKEYRYQQQKYHLKSLPANSFQFFGMRPHNFPTVRMAQLAALYHQQSSLFSKIIPIQELHLAYELFQIQLDDFWLTHYTFSKSSPKRKKVLSRNFVDLVLINTIVPIQFAYAKSRNRNNVYSFELLRQMDAERNGIIDKFREIGVEAADAFESQSLIELKNNYCTKKRCLQCAIGLKLLQ